MPYMLFVRCLWYLNKLSAQNKNDIATTASRKPLFHKRNTIKLQNLKIINHEKDPSIHGSFSFI